MSKGRWIIAVAFGLTIATSLQAQEQAGSANDRSNAKQEPSHSLPIPLPVQIIEDDEASEARKASESEATQREKDDLVAQQGMNAATQAMNEATQSMKWASWVSAGLIAVGTFLLIWTLQRKHPPRAAVRQP
ncbi:hypothetical protein [Roseovarius azorensis]|uniref:hypothetical protein n=1 Tax=Roseovarius azorensis TaxID=1287727 RepID=UPI0011147AA9|nr:hypothetical protein [Roseovarius azorensis]